MSRRGGDTSCITSLPVSKGDALVTPLFPSEVLPAIDAILGALLAVVAAGAFSVPIHAPVCAMSVISNRRTTNFKRGLRRVILIPSLLRDLTGQMIVLARRNRYA